eukprot:9496131-Pyramimonas_sp.AAC.1
MIGKQTRSHAGHILYPLLRLVRMLGVYCLPSFDWFARWVYAVSPPSNGSHAGYMWAGEESGAQGIRKQVGQPAGTARTRLPARHCGGLAPEKTPVASFARHRRVVNQVHGAVGGVCARRHHPHFHLLHVFHGVQTRHDTLRKGQDGLSIVSKT